MKQLHELDPREATALVKENNCLNEHFYISWERHEKDGSISNWDILKIHHDLLSAKIDLLNIVMCEELEDRLMMDTSEKENYIKNHFSNDGLEWFNGKDRYAIYSL